MSRATTVSRFDRRRRSNTRQTAGLRPPAWPIWPFDLARRYHGERARSSLQARSDGRTGDGHGRTSSGGDLRISRFDWSSHRPGHARWRVGGRAVELASRRRLVARDRSNRFRPYTRSCSPACSSSRSIAWRHVPGFDDSLGGASPYPWADIVPFNTIGVALGPVPTGRSSQLSTSAILQTFVPLGVIHRLHGPPGTPAAGSCDRAGNLGAWLSQLGLSLRWATRYRVDLTSTSHRQWRGSVLVMPCSGRAIGFAARAILLSDSCSGA